MPVVAYRAKKPEVFLFEESIQKVSLSGLDIDSIDLSEVSHIPRLQHLDLSRNALTEIDLKPLERILELESLDLSHNSITKINLSPLKRCRKLSWLSLSANRLENIDLSPLRACNELEYLFLAGNKFETLDLRPISISQKLREISLTTGDEPGFRTIETALDLRPLARLKRLKKVHIDRRTIATLGLTQTVVRPESKGVTDLLTKENMVTLEKYVRHVLEKHGIVEGIELIEREVERLPTPYWYEIRKEIFRLLGLEAIAGYGGSIAKTVRDVFSPDEDWIDLTIAKVADEISNGATTILFDINAISMDLPSHGKLRSAILESRTNEIRKGQVYVCETCADYREIWYTAWGFQVLKEGGYWFFGNSGKQLIDLRDRLRELGFGLTFISVKLRDKWPGPRNEPSKRIRQLILGYVDLTAKQALKKKAMRCIMKSTFHPLQIELEKIMNDIYGG